MKSGSYCYDTSSGCQGNFFFYCQWIVFIDCFVSWLFFLSTGLLISHFLMTNAHLMKWLCVAALTIILSSKYFGCDVIRCTTERARRIARSQALLQKQEDHQQRDPLRGLYSYTYAALKVLLWALWYKSLGFLIYSKLQCTPCTCHSPSVWCVLQSPAARCPALDLCRWFPARGGSWEPDWSPQSRIWKRDASVLKPSKGHNVTSILLL